MKYDFIIFACKREYADKSRVVVILNFRICVCDIFWLLQKGFF